MKRLLLPFLLISLVTGSAQETFEPRILILAPGKVHSDPYFDSEVADVSQMLKSHIEESSAEAEMFIGSQEFLEMPLNIQIMARDEYNFLKQLDFFSHISYIAEQYMIVQLYDRFPESLIRLSNIASSSKPQKLAKLAKQENVSFILNFPYVELFRKDNQKYAKITVQLYEQASGRLLIDQTYIGNELSPGFEFSCRDHSISCTVNNAMAQALYDILPAIAENDAAFKKQKAIEAAKDDLLLNTYYPQPYDSDLVRNAIPSSDTTILLNTLFHCITAPDKQKFVAFFIEENPEGKSISEVKKRDDMHINVEISSGSQGGSFDKAPPFYASIVQAVWYKGMWYYEKSKVTYFSAANVEEAKKMYFLRLKNWGFFPQKSATPDPDFWETGLFEKVPDLRQDPSWDELGDNVWASTEKRNREYIGLYVIVADQLKAAVKREQEAFEASLSKEVLIPFLEKVKEKDPLGFRTYNLFNDSPILIYPKDKSAVLFSVEAVNEVGEKTLRYYLIFPPTGQILRWTYFEEHPLDPSTIKGPIPNYGTMVRIEMETLTQWNFSYDTLDDPAFWSTYVFPKNAEGYIYLKTVE